MLKRILFCCMVLVLSACNEAPTSTPEALAANDWTAVAIGETTQFERAPNLKIDLETSKIMGSTGCNRFFGTVNIDANQITITNIGSTKMACQDMAVENSFMEILKQTHSYKIDKNSLTLHSEDLNILAKFKALKNP